MKQFLSKKRNALDRQLKYLRNIGVGVVKKQVPVITHEAENMLWERKIIGIDTPQSLLNTVFLNRGNFVLRGITCTKQLELQFGQIILRKSRSNSLCGAWKHEK